MADIFKNAGPGGGQSLKSLLLSFLNGRRCSYVFN